MTKQFSSFSNKLIALTLALSIIPIFLIGSFLYIDKINTEVNNLKERLVSISGIGSNNISEWVSERKNNVLAIASDQTIILGTKKLSDLSINQDERFETQFKLEEDFQSYLNIFKNLQDLTISDPKTGEALFHSTTLRPDIHLKEQKHFQDAGVGKIGISQVFSSQGISKNEFGQYEKNIPTLLISAPIISETGIEGILTARVNIFQINPNVEPYLSDFVTSDVYLINSQGYMISKSSYSQLAKNFGLFEKRPELELRVTEPESNENTKIIQDAKKTETVWNLNGYQNYLGTQVVGSISPVEGTDWSYIAEIDLQEAFLEIKILQISLISSIFVVILIVIGASFYFSTNFTKTIIQLKDTAEQVTKGNFDFKTEIKSTDEIGELSKSFGIMVSNLRKMTDIEYQLALQKNLRKSLDESSIVSIISPSGTITYVNEKFCKVSKYAKEEIIGRDQRILRAGVHSLEFYDELWKTISSGKVWHGDICNKAQDGTLFWNKCTIVPFFDKNYNIEEYVAIRSDITKEKETTEKLQKTLTELQKSKERIEQQSSELIKKERLSSIGQLASRLGHDLRNPLSTIKTTSAIIKMKAAMEKDDKYKKNLASIDDAVDRMAYQIESVLDFIKIKPLQIGSNSLYNIIKDTIQTIKVPENIRITLEPTDAKIMCDPQRISIIFTNLVTNAIQAIREDTGGITISTKENDEFVTCSITDSGPGIPEDKMKKIFEPLFTTKQTGTGLGLSSCSNIVQQHNGKITVHNNPTTFTISIPKRQLKSPQLNEMIVQRLKE